MEDDDLLRKAFAAYFRSGATDQPSSKDSGVESVDGLRYAVLRNCNGVLRVYRVRNDGVLKGLKRWPAALDDGSAQPAWRVDSFPLASPVGRTEELLAPDRELTPGEVQEIKEHFATAAAVAAEMKRLVQRMEKAIKKAESRASPA